MNTSETINELIRAQSRLDHHAESAALRGLRLKTFKSGWQHSSTPLPQRILERVAWGATDCWHWIAADNGHGYGRMTYAGRSQLAHRLSYRAFKGTIPAGLSVLHTCDNPACVNPDHLWLGSHSDNMRDAWAKGRHPGKGGHK